MSMSRFAIAAALAAVLAGEPAWAQQNGVRTADHRASTGFVDGETSLTEISYAPKDMAEPPSPSDQTAAPAPAACEAEEDETEYKLHHGLFGRCLCCPVVEDEEVCDIPFCCKWFRCCGTEYQPTRFFNRNPCRRILFDGYMCGGYVYNPYQPADKFNGPYNWMDRANEINLQEMWLNLHRDVDTGGCGFDWGFQATTVYGTNTRFITAAGFEDAINKTSPFYGLAFPNMNAQVGYNDLKLTVGRFVSPVGYYTVGQGNNFFSHIPYTYQYGELFTQTGILAQYQITDDLNIGGGFSYGWDNFDHRWNKTTAPYGIIVRNNLLKCGDSLAVFSMYSREPSLGPTTDPNAAIRYGMPVAPFTPRFLNTVVYSRPICDSLSYVAQSDFGAQDNIFGTGTRTAYWYGLNQYLYYKLNNCVSYGLNAEWFRDDAGARVGGFLPNIPNNTVGGPTATRGLSTLRSGYDGSFYRVAFGVNVKPHANILARTSLVWDWYSGPPNTNGVDPSNGLPTSLPFLNGSSASRTQVILANDLVLFF